MAIILDTPIKRQISSRMKIAGLNASALSEKAGLNDTAVKQILHGKSKSPKVDTVLKIAAALDCSILDLLEISLLPSSDTDTQIPDVDVLQFNGDHYSSIRRFDLKAAPANPWSQPSAMAILCWSTSNKQIRGDDRAFTS